MARPQESDGKSEFLNAARYADLSASDLANFIKAIRENPADLSKRGITSEEAERLATALEDELQATAKHADANFSPFDREPHRQDDAGPVSADHLRFMSWMNAKHALINEHGKVLIVRERFDDVLNRIVLDRSTAADFKLFYRNHLIADGKKRVPLGDFWLDHAGRRQYEEIIFDPNPARKEKKDSYNLWRGWSVTPAPGKWTDFYGHLLMIGAAGDSETLNFILDWFAWMFQFPHKPAETAIVWRGTQGAGKGFIARAVGHIVGQHFVHVTQIGHLVGHFNAHLQDALLVFSDEAFWAGDVQHTGVIKTIITEPTFILEKKGRDVVSGMPNRAHLMMATNNDWAVPVAMDDRRFCVVDVPDSVVGLKSYFQNIQTELENGGYAAFLYDMLRRPISRAPVPPVSMKTSSAMLSQKIYSMTPVQRWWYEKLENGFITRDSEGWPTEMRKVDLHEDYLKHLERLGISRRSTETELGMSLRKLCPGLWEQKRQSSTLPEAARVRYWRFPDLEKCRAAFATEMRFPHLFPPDIQES